MALKAIAFASLTVLFALNSEAQTPTPSPTPSKAKPVHNSTNGQMYSWTFSDGREMAVFAQVLPPSTLKFSFGFNESTCKFPVTKKPTCTITVPVRTTNFQIRWTKNPDPAKIGQMVKFYQSEQKNELQVSTYEQLKLPKVGVGLTPTTFQCDDFTWLAGTKLAPPLTTLSSLSSEFMLQNPETGQQENRTFVQILDPKLKKVSGDSIALISSGQWLSEDQAFLSFGLIAGNVYHWVLDQKPTEPACQISLKPNLGNAQMQLEQYEKTAVQSIQFEPVINGQIDLHTAAGQFENYIESEESVFE